MTGPGYQDSTLFRPAWPEGVIARYVTVGGATVDLSQHPHIDDDIELLDAIATCLGCTTSERFCETTPLWGSQDALAANTATARVWAQRHAETCRALPRPDGAS